MENGEIVPLEAYDRNTQTPEIEIIDRCICRETSFLVFISGEHEGCTQMFANHGFR